MMWLINKYIVSRALCCPFNIDETLNEKIISNVINQQYIQKITNNIYETVLKIIKLSFPSIEENIDFLNKQREENKQGKIKILNDKTVEDNKLIKIQLKLENLLWKIFMNSKKKSISKIKLKSN